MKGLRSMKVDSWINKAEHTSLTIPRFHSALEEADGISFYCKYNLKHVTMT